MPRPSTAQRYLFRFLRGEPAGPVEPAHADQLLALLHRHRLIPSAADLLNNLDEKNREKWKQTIRVQSMRSLGYLSLLAHLAEAFGKEGIETVPLKGPVLAYRLYGDVGKRQFVDLDLLVKHRDIHHIIATARKAGCELVQPKAGLTPREWDYYFRFRKDLRFIHQESGMSVELHTGLYYHGLLPRPDTDFLWRRTTDLRMGETTYRVMLPENSFIYLAYHGAFHQYMRLFWLKDVATALETWEIDHQAVLEAAGRLGIQRMLGVSLVLARRYFNSDVPPDYGYSLEQNAGIIGRLERLCSRRIVEPIGLNLPRKLFHQYYMSLLRPGARYRWSVITGILHRRRIGGRLE